MSNSQRQVGGVRREEQAGGTIPPVKSPGRGDGWSGQVRDRRCFFLSPLAVCCGRTYAHHADLSLHDVLLIPWPKARCMLGLFYDERYVSQTSDPYVAIFKRLFEASSSLLTFFALLASRMGLRQVGVGGRLDAETSIIS